MGQVILDSSVVIAFFNASDAHHEGAKQAIVEGDNSFSISAVTLTETLMSAARVSKERSNQFLTVLGEHFRPFLPVTTEVAVLAAEVKAATGLRTPDAIISATASVNKATLWTCDVRLAKLHKGARLIG